MNSQTVYETVKGESRILNMIRKLKIPTEKFEEKLLTMDMTAEQFVDYIGYDEDVFINNVANVKKDILHEYNFNSNLVYRVELKIKELKKHIDEEPECLEYRLETRELETYKKHMKLIKMKYNFYLRFLKYYRDTDNQELYDNCKSMYDKIVETVKMRGETWYELVVDDLNIFIPTSRLDFINIK